MTYYYDSSDIRSSFLMGQKLKELISGHKKASCPIILLCIGTDRSTGDSLGPLIGYKLSRRHFSVFIYGTLKDPVHAINLVDTIQLIEKKHPGALIIAIDASLGTSSHVGYITMGYGSLKPGLGVKKDLPGVGDIFITGIVNFSGFLDQVLLQTTRLSTVMQLADCICMGLSSALLYRERALEPQ